MMAHPAYERKRLGLYTTNDNTTVQQGLGKRMKWAMASILACCTALEGRVEEAVMRGSWGLEGKTVF